MTKYKLIIFDLDGTLADTSSGILECHRFANAAMGRPVTGGSMLEGVIGGPLLATYMDHFGYPECDAKKAVQIYRKHYEEIGFSQSKLYPGMDECLLHLKKCGHLLAVATLKAEWLAKRVLDMLGIGSFFDVICGMDANDTLSKMDLIFMCMTTLGAGKDETILVGDTMHDAKGAQQAGIDFLGVTYGFGFEKNDSGSNAFDMVDNCTQLKNRLIGWETLGMP